MAFHGTQLRAITASFVTCAALLAACSGDDGPDGTVVPLDFCTPPDWVAIKDGNGPWQHILPVEGVYEATFETAKAGLAWANGPGGSLAGVIVQYGLPSELAIHCPTGAASGERFGHCHRGTGAHSSRPVPARMHSWLA